MIRIIYESGISSTHIKDEIWYPEINRKADDYYSYLYHEAGRTNGLTVITYSPIILTCLEVISQERNIDLEVELNGQIYKNEFSEIYKVHAIPFSDVMDKRRNIVSIV